ncbi:hypothetical protein U205_02764, partial [Staphylococcus aureus T34696]
MNNISVFNILILIIILVIAYKLLPVIVNFLKKKKIQSIYR